MGEAVGQTLSQEEYGLPTIGIVLGKRCQGGGLLTCRCNVPLQFIFELPHGRAIKFSEIARQVPVHGCLE